MTQKAKLDFERLIADHLGLDVNRIETSDWYGSCQYSAIEDMHKLLNKIGPKELGVTFDYIYIKPTKALLADWKEELVRAKDTELLKDDKYLKGSLDDIAKWGANQAWDLWSVAFWLADFQSRNTLKYHESYEGFDSIQAGAACWFLVEKCGMTTKALDGMCT